MMGHAMGNSLLTSNSLREVGLSFVSFVLFAVLLVSSVNAAERPNVLWISLEDISPDLGCYGDEYAVTPNIDKLAAAGCRYTHVFTHAGVCAPSRSGII